jgi:hypothetical protein
VTQYLPRKRCKTRGCFTKTSRRNGLCNRCDYRECEKPKLHRGYNHNLPPGRLEELLEARGCACEICGVPLTIDTVRVDHDHRCCPGRRRSCGKCIRGLLCSGCNTGLGQLGDTYATLKRAGEYLLRWERLTDGRGSATIRDVVRVIPHTDPRASEVVWPPKPKRVGSTPT